MQVERVAAARPSSTLSARADAGDDEPTCVPIGFMRVPPKPTNPPRDGSQARRARIVTTHARAREVIHAHRHTRYYMTGKEHFPCPSPAGMPVY